MYILSGGQDVKTLPALYVRVTYAISTKLSALSLATRSRSTTRFGHISIAFCCLISTAAAMLSCSQTPTLTSTLPHANIAVQQALVPAAATTSRTIASLKLGIMMAAVVESENKSADSAHMDHQDDVSSGLSSVDSSDLSSVEDSEDEAHANRAVGKRRRRNRSTPPSSVGEYTKRRKAVKSGPTEYDVPDRKTYFEAGLYSGATNNAGGTRGRVKRTAKIADKLSKPREEVIQSFKFNLPMFHGMTILGQNRDFRLPWDILNDFDLSRLPDTPEGLIFRSSALDRFGRQKKPPAYKHISQSRSWSFAVKFHTF
jgi:hypothetical protein